MISLRTFALVCALLAATSVSAGTVGFSAVSADRDVSVAVVEDEQAYVDVEVCEASDDSETETEDGESDDGDDGDDVLVRVSNQYTNDLHVSIASDDSIAADADEGPTVSVGTQEQFEVEFDDRPETVTVDVMASDFEASITRSVTTTAECDFLTDPPNDEESDDDDDEAEIEESESDSDDDESDEEEAGDDSDDE